MKNNVEIRPLLASDAKQLAQLANNKKVWDNLRNYIPFPYTENHATFFINQTKEENPQQNFGITYGGDLCGVIGLILQKDVYSKSAEIGYWLGEPYWGKGLATQAVSLIMNYGFTALDIVRVYTGVFDYNTASMKVLEKNGFKKEGVFKNAIFKNGKISNEHRFFKLKEDSN